MIETDKVIYRTRTEEEYNWLLQQLEKADCWWCNEISATLGKFYYRYLSDTCIWVEDKTITYGEYRYYKNNLQDYSTHELIEVSDIMETEEETEAQDDTEEETGALDELEAIHKQVTNQITDLRKQGKEPKTIEYTIKVCFE